MTGEKKKQDFTCFAQSTSNARTQCCSHLNITHMPFESLHQVQNHPENVQNIKASLLRQ